MKLHLLCGAALAALSLASCKPGPAKAQAAATPQEAAEFMKTTEDEFLQETQFYTRVDWVNATYITSDTNALKEKADKEYTDMQMRQAIAARRFDGLQLDPILARKMSLLKTAIVAPAPSSGTKAENDKAGDEKSAVLTRMNATYSAGKFTIDGKQLNLEQLSDILATSRDPAKLKQAWEGWRTVSPSMAKDYARWVEIGNKGAQDLGYKDLADLWLSGYDMPADKMAAEVERLWTQVKPLYDELHCYTRAKLNAKYGDAVQPKTGPIRADLLGNMWSQDWSNIYPLVAPKTSDASIDLTAILKAKKFDELKMVKTGEGFYTSLGFPPLPQSFWEKSLIKRPADREVTCHASAWDFFTKGDYRVKMCTQINAEDFQTVHHELGHNFYQRSYENQDPLFRNGANDGFHEAIGDFVALSVTPEYLKQLGLVDKTPGPEADTGLLMNRALEKVAFLPFGLMVDKWRWQVFRGETKPEQYNLAWWDLAKQYQGIAPPGPRPADAFDPGAKFHIPNNTPYLRYFLSYVLQFQFQKAACEQAGWTGPLHRCSIYGNKAVGAKFAKMLEMGASKPWPDALEAFTGTRQIDGSAMVAYFDPLMGYLKEQNQGQQCGWSGIGR